MKIAPLRIAGDLVDVYPDTAHPVEGKPGWVAVMIVDGQMTPEGNSFEGCELQIPELLLLCEMTLPGEKPNE